MSVVILGASTRAAAFSADRAGLRPWCVDLFADADLERRFPVRRVPIEKYPRGLIAAMRDAPEGPVIYTGGLENHPELIGQIDRPLWGNPPSVLRRVRSPYLLADALRSHGLPTLLVRADPPSAGDPRQWLLKPLRGSGGVGVRQYTRRSFFDPRTHYLQEYSPGDCFGAVFLGDGAQAALLGLTRHVRADWLHAPAFHYAGSVLTLTPPQSNLRRIADAIAGTFSLRGLFGVDLVHHADPATGVANFCVLEVNPRYTASVEVLERAQGWALLTLHQAIFEGRLPHWQPIATAAVAGKAVLYARRTFTFPDDGPWRDAWNAPLRDSDYADIPHAGETIERGRPVMTVFASADDDIACMQGLREKVEALDRYLWG